MKTFQYKTTRHRKYQGGRRAHVAPDQEQLTGVLQGKRATVGEERWYRAVHRTGKAREYHVQVQIGSPGLPGYRTLDALVRTDLGWRAFEVDGMAFVHRGDIHKAHDRLADFQRVEGLRKMGIALRRGIEHIPDTKLANQRQADFTARTTI